MIKRLVESALQTGCLSVESEGLIRQLLAVKQVNPSDADALHTLQLAVQQGQVQREARPHKLASNATSWETLSEFLFCRQNKG